MKADTKNSDTRVQKRKAYQAPELIYYGSLTELTRYDSGGGNDAFGEASVPFPDFLESPNKP